MREKEKTEREREKTNKCMLVCVNNNCVRGYVCVCVCMGCVRACMCVKERERKKERAKETICVMKEKREKCVVRACVREG